MQEHTEVDLFSERLPIAQGTNDAEKAEKTVVIDMEEGVDSISLEDALDNLADEDRTKIINFVSKHLGVYVPIEHLNWTYRVLTETHKIYKQMHKERGCIYFNDAHKEIEERLKDIYERAKKRDIYFIAYCDMFHFIEEHYLTDEEKRMLRRAYPDPIDRAVIFANYAHSKMYLKEKKEERRRRGWLVRILDKVFEAIKQYFSVEHKLCEIFNEILRGEIKKRLLKRANLTKTYKPVVEDQLYSSLNT